MTDTASTRAAESSRVRMLCAVTLLALSLAGCSSTPDDAAPEPSNSDASPHSPEPTEFIPASSEGPAQHVPEPHLPAAVTENSEEGARATLEYFWEAEEYARLTGRPEPLELVSAQECEFCTDSIVGWPSSYEEGVWNVPENKLSIVITDTEYADMMEDRPPVAHIYYDLYEPGTAFFNSSGELEDESFETPEVSEWFAILYFDATVQRWEISWIDLAEHIVRDDPQ